MITDPYLKQVVEESGRCEITIDMIVEAEKRKWDRFCDFTEPLIPVRGLGLLPYGAHIGACLGLYATF